MILILILKETYLYIYFILFQLYISYENVHINSVDTDDLDMFLEHIKNAYNFG